MEKRIISDASLDAYKELLPHVTDRQKSILKLFIATPNELCINDIVSKLNWQINRVSGRITELNNLGYIASVGRKLRMEYSNVPVHHYKITEHGKNIFKPKQVQLFN